MADAAGLIGELRSIATEPERRKYERYFPPDPDAPFLGVPMGRVFALAKTAIDLPPAELEALLERPEHEVRALACSVMGKSAAHRRTADARRDDLFDLYLRRHDRIDQWDLVDLAARDVIGARLVDADRSLLDRLGASAPWPKRRTALVATFAFLRLGETDDTFRLAAALADDEHPYVHKAVGWVLRSAGDLEPDRLVAFVEARAARMPRAALRAAIEHVPADERKRILAIR